MTSEGKGLVSPSDIAELADVSRGAVSNWRKRQPDFPEQVAGTPSKPLFSRAAVEEWLAGRGYKVRRDRGDVRVWAALNELRGTMEMEEMQSLVLALASARKLSDASELTLPPWIQIQQAAPTRGFRAVSDVVEQLAIEDPRWERFASLPPGLQDLDAAGAIRLVTAFDDIDPADLGDVCDYVLQRTAIAQIRSGAEHGLVQSRVSRLLGKLAAMAPVEVIYDPACGVGSAMTACLDAGATPRHLVGHDINGQALRIAAQRAFLRGLEFELTRTDTLREDVDPDLRADVIVAEPPFSLRWDAAGSLTDPRYSYGTPPASSADLAWIQHCVAHLAEGGRAYVVTPMATLFRSGAERAIRTELVRRGCVEAVFALPGKMLPHVSIPLAVWVLCRPGEATNGDEIYFVHGVDAPNPEDHVAEWLLENAEDMPPTASVSRTDVLAADANLVPQHWLPRNERDPDEIARAHRDSRQAVQVDVEGLRAAARGIAHAPALPQARVSAVADLLRQGVLDIRQGRHRPERDEDGNRRTGVVVTAADLRAGPINAGQEVMLDALPDREATSPGDILVTTVHSVVARVDDLGGHLLAQGLYRVRVVDPSQLAPEYLALMLMGPWNERFLVGSSVRRAPLRDLEVPMVSRHAQDEILAVVSNVQDVVHQAEALAAHARAVAATLLEAVRHNANLDLQKESP
jgi:hypothetical protein